VAHHSLPEQFEEHSSPGPIVSMVRNMNYFHGDSPRMNQQGQKFLLLWIADDNFCLCSKPVVLEPKSELVGTI